MSISDNSGIDTLHISKRQSSPLTNSKVPSSQGRLEKIDVAALYAINTTTKLAPAHHINQALAAGYLIDLRFVHPTATTSLFSGKEIKSCMSKAGYSKLQFASTANDCSDDIIMRKEIARRNLLSQRH